MNLGELIIALKERRKWEASAAELSRKLEGVEREIETVTEKLKNLEGEIRRMKEMLYSEPSGKVEMRIDRIKEEVK